MQKTASMIGFLEQALFHQFTPTFPKLKGNFISSIDKNHAEKKVIKKHLFKYRKNLKHLKKRLYQIINEVLKLVGRVILRILLIDLCNSLHKSNILQLKTKNNNIHNFRLKHSNKTSPVPVKSLADYDIDTSSLKHGLNHSFIDKKSLLKGIYQLNLNH